MRNLRLLTSLDLRWLSRHARGIPVPKLVVDDDLIDCGGYYFPSVDSEAIINDDLVVDGKSGVIVVSGYHAERHHSTIAHEWRHHWQMHTGNGWDVVLDWNYEELGYERSIAEYFKQPHELDALLFERRVAPSEVNEEWFDVIHEQDAKCRLAVAETIRK